MNATELQEVVDEFFLVEKEFNEEDHPRDESGRFTWAGGGGVAGKLANLIRVAGGFTYQPVTDSQPKTGKMVGKPGHERQIKGIPKAEQIKAYLDENAAEFKDPDAYCGGWHNPEDDTTYLDISERYETDEEAAAASIAARQEAYYDLATGETTYVRAREAEWIEAKARLVQTRDVAGGDPADHRRDVGDRSEEDRWGALRALLLKEFDPNQPRDERGQWTDSGGGAVATAEPRTLDERIRSAARVEVSTSLVYSSYQPYLPESVSPKFALGFVTEDGRFLHLRGAAEGHDSIARDLGYVRGGSWEAVEDGLTRMYVWPPHGDREYTQVVIEGKDREHIVSTARFINRGLNEDQRSSAVYIWEEQGENRFTGAGSYRDLIGRKTLWQRLKAILTGEKRSQDQLARDRLALNRLGAERLARLAEDAINDYVPELSRGISETTYDAIKGAVIMARSEGGGSIEVQRAIDHLFSPERAQRVAITETTRLFGKGSQAVYREQGVTGWQWSTCNDPWVCAICEELQDEVFEADDEFEPAHVNCRCFPRPYMIDEGD